jgi:hypothetical protein
VDVRARARFKTAKNMYWRDLGDLVLVILLSPVVYVFVTRLPALAAVVFSSLLISG